ncbi:MAG TPA: YihY/virulence factor BrkB family protein [Terriglobales bacterium]|nr:YihY/virulence factor BrkB family protein [Terriglobales bacterium]
MYLRRVWRALLKAFKDMDQHHLLAFAGSLAYYFFMSLIPFLIFLASLLVFVPIHGLFDYILSGLSHLLPADSMAVVRKVVVDLITTNRKGFLSFGIVGTIWSASGGFSAMIEALNVAYDVQEGRPFWKTRPLAVLLTIIVGALVTVLLFAMFFGPHWGGQLASKMNLSPLFTKAWFYFRWVLAGICAILSVEIIYYLAPNVEQRRFIRTVPGSIIAVILWMAASYGLGFYLQHFAQLSKSYGALGAIVGLLLWFYVTSAAILIGAEVNAELARAVGKQPPVKQPVEPGKEEVPQIRRAS